MPLKILQTLMSALVRNQKRRQLSNRMSNPNRGLGKPETGNKGQGNRYVEVYDAPGITLREAYSYGTMKSKKPKKSKRLKIDYRKFFNPGITKLGTASDDKEVTKKIKHRPRIRRSL